MIETLENCYGDDGTPVSVTFVNDRGSRTIIPEYIAYYSATQRCNNYAQHQYDHYKDKGIEFRFNNFTEWWNELGKRPTPEHSIDRIDGEGHYEVGNVRWATITEQNINRNSVRKVRLTYPDGSVSDFQTMIDATRNSIISNMSMWNMCHGKRETIQGYQASFIN